MKAVAFAGLVAFAFYLSLHPPAPLVAKVKATALKFMYHPVEQGRPEGPEVPLLAGAPLDELSIRSFDTLTARSGIMSVRDAADQPWQVVQSKGPLVIESRNGSPANAIFPRVTIEEWRFDGQPAVTLELPGGQPVLRAFIEGKDIELFFDAGDSIEFECQLCRIDGLDRDGAAPARQMKLSGLNHVALKASSRSAMVLNATPGPKGFGSQRFRISRPWFCGGNVREPESSVVGGTVEFTVTRRVHSLPVRGSANSPESVFRLVSDGTFSVTDFRVADVNGRSALDVQLDGIARAELSAACDAGGRPIQPPRAEALLYAPIVATPYYAILLLLGWLVMYDKVSGLWARVFPKDAGK